MLILLWRLSAAIAGYSRTYMPTNRAIDWLRSRHGLKWAIPVSLVATLGYLGLTTLCMKLAEHPDLGLLNVLVFLYFYNAAKFAWLVVLGSVRLLAGVVVHRELGDVVLDG